jgi:hypothetical protein
MFEIDSGRTSLALPPDRILALVVSLNAPLVVANDMPVEPTRAYVCAYKEGGDRVGFSIYLHCVQSEKGAFYKHDGGLLSMSRFDEAMNEAMAFLESLGFMMDDLNWAELDRKRRAELVAETPLFREPRPSAPEPPAAEPPAPEPAAATPPPEPPAPPTAPPARGAPTPTPPPPAPGPPAPPPAAQPPPQPAAARSLETLFVPPPTAAGPQPAQPRQPAAGPPAPAASLVDGPVALETEIETEIEVVAEPSVDDAVPGLERFGTDAPAAAAPGPRPAPAPPRRAEAEAAPPATPPRPGGPAASASPGPGDVAAASGNAAAARPAAGASGLAAAARSLVRILASL